MKYKLVTFKKNGLFCDCRTYDTIEKAEEIGFIHTNLENYYINEIPIKNERLFRVYEITDGFNIMDCLTKEEVSK